LEILRAHVDGLRPLDRTKWLAHVAKAGTVRPWTPTLTAAGVDGFVDAVAQATEGASAREVGRLVAGLLGDGLETALERAIDHEAGTPAGPRTDRAA
jgi:hypothetical protein